MVMVFDLATSMAVDKQFIHYATSFSCDWYVIITFYLFLFDLILYVHSTIFQLCGTGLPGLNQY